MTDSDLTKKQEVRSSKSMSNSEKYPRDMVGYGAQPPNANWPNRARIAVQFVINYEEGGGKQHIAWRCRFRDISL